MSTGLVSSEAALLGMWMVAFSLFTPSQGRPSGRVCVLISSWKGIGQIALGPILMTVFSLNYLFRDPIFECILLGVRTPACGCPRWGTQPRAYHGAFDKVTAASTAAEPDSKPSRQRSWLLRSSLVTRYRLCP